MLLVAVAVAVNPVLLLLEIAGLVSRCEVGEDSHLVRPVVIGLEFLPSDSHLGSHLLGRQVGLVLLEALTLLLAEEEVGGLATLGALTLGRLLLLLGLLLVVAVVRGGLVGFHFLQIALLV